MSIFDSVGEVNVDRPSSLKLEDMIAAIKGVSSIFILLEKDPNQHDNIWARKIQIWCENFNWNCKIINRLDEFPEAKGSITISRISSTSSLHYLIKLEEMGSRCINSPISFIKTMDKMIMYRVLNEHNLKTPKCFINKTKITKPKVVLENDGKKSVMDQATAKLFLENIDKAIAIESIDTDYHVVVANGRIAGAYGNNKPSSLIELKCIEAAEALDLDWCEIECDKDGVIVEVYPSPSIEDKDLINKSLSLLFDENKKSPLIVNLTEFMNIPGVGEVQIRFNTGNETISKLSCENVLFNDDKTVYFKIAGKDIKRKYNRKVLIREGMVPRHTATVNFDIEICGRTFKNVEFYLEDKRKDDISFLNLDFLKKNGAIIRI